MADEVVEAVDAVRLRVKRWVSAEPFRETGRRTAEERPRVDDRPCARPIPLRQIPEQARLTVEQHADDPLGGRDARTHPRPRLEQIIWLTVIHEFHDLRGECAASSAVRAGDRRGGAVAAPL